MCAKDPEEIFLENMFSVFSKHPKEVLQISYCHVISQIFLETNDCFCL